MRFERIESSLLLCTYFIPVSFDMAILNIIILCNEPGKPPKKVLRHTWSCCVKYIFLASYSKLLSTVSSVI